MRMFKKDRGWKLRMFKKGKPWQMRMFKRIPYDEDLDKDSKGRNRLVYKRFPVTGFGKRPDRWQMRMFKRDQEGQRETIGDFLR